jgi:hypothetical protein
MIGGPIRFVRSVSEPKVDDRNNLARGRVSYIDATVVRFGFVGISDRVDQLPLCTDRPQRGRVVQMIGGPSDEISRTIVTLGHRSGATRRVFNVGRARQRIRHRQCGNDRRATDGENAMAWRWLARRIGLAWRGLARWWLGLAWRRLARRIGLAWRRLARRWLGLAHGVGRQARLGWRRMGLAAGFSCRWFGDRFGCCN